MSTEHPDLPEPPDGRIGWAIFVLATVFFCLIGGGLAPFGLLPSLADGLWFWVALAFGFATALVVNLVRPRYESTTGRWRAFYDFLLKQLPPPD